MDNDDIRTAQILDQQARDRRQQERQPRLPTERYKTDIVFRHLVDIFSAAIERAEYTPTEIREAAMLAQIMYEETHLRPLILDTVRHILIKDPPWA